MHVKNGLYQIRFVPRHVRLPFMGGVYASGEQINAPVRAEALGTDSGLQTWHIQRDGEAYTISCPGFGPTPPEFGPGPILPGWGRRTKYAADEPVLFTTGLHDWDISLFKDGATGEGITYNIGVPTKPGQVGADFWVADVDGVLTLKAFPVIEDMPPAPRWQLIYLGEKKD